MATTENQLGSMEEIAQSANSLAHMAEELKEFVSRFNIQMRKRDENLFEADDYPFFVFSQICFTD
ncbi:hypothetical protein DW881_02910 [Exiguobacterium sp. AM39-5BH]|nr:hypothetical protein DW881_02910 [Exiguobacterium sp. AM39-5BH]